MIIVKLFGGLGNQMFQYACGRALALKNQTNLKADLSWFDSVKIIDTSRQYKLGVFNTVIQKAANKETRPFQFQNLLFKLGLHRKSYVREKFFQFDEEVLNQKDGIYLDGHWQSEKYFLDFKDTIRNDFNLRYPMDREAADVHGKIKQTPVSCAIHVRRGDYVSDFKTNIYHGVCSLDYYKKAVGYIKSNFGEIGFFVFSDDIQWAKDNFNFGETVFVELSDKEGLKDQQELILMSRCQHQIIANSSFSWWGAWLNQNPQKIVVVPQKWSNNPMMSTKDLLLESWVKI